MKLYHICEQLKWESADNAVYAPDSLNEEGFVHLSTKEQLLKTWLTYYKNKPGLTCLVLDIPENDSSLIFDYVPARNEKLPHYYRSLPRKYIIDIQPIPEFEEDVIAFFYGL